MEKALELEPHVQIFERDNIKKTKSTMPMAHLPICSHSINFKWSTARRRSCLLLIY
ncbi:hypothetical protein NC651_028052 [Populus alba x Populus x berolinensis]|nr:hypothetical protein NC651_028052 [Populus alba x Populus x berolinensis]